MEINIIHQRLQGLKGKLEDAEKTHIETDKQIYEDFLLWLAGFLEAVKNTESNAIKIMVDTLEKKKL